MANTKSGPIKVSFTSSLTYATLIPLALIILAAILFFGIYLASVTESRTKEFLVKQMLMPEFELLAREKNNEFQTIKELTEYTARKAEEKIAAANNKTHQEIDEEFIAYLSKKNDGSYRSSLVESKGRYQMAAFHNNRDEVDYREKAILADAFGYFEPFAEGLMGTVHDTYFASDSFIWEYGAPEWPLTVPANETFGGYNWFYDADPEHNPASKHVWTDIYYDDYQSKWMISSLMPIYDSGEFVGIIGQDFILDRIMQITNRSRVGHTGVLFFVDSEGNIVAHPDTAYILNRKAVNDAKLSLKSIQDTALMKALQNLTAEKDFALTEEKDRRIILHFHLESVDWMMVYIIDESEILQIAEETNGLYIASFAVFSFLTLIIILMIVKARVIRPIENLTDAANKISEGNLDTQIRMNRDDELGRLSASFSQMTGHLKESRIKLETYAGELEMQVKERTAELSAKIVELEHINQLAVGREMRMVELKKRISDLEDQAGSNKGPSS